ncbi:MAG: PHP domain-containing protein, partial [Chloroflexi bacterium]
MPFHPLRSLTQVPNASRSTRPAIKAMSTKTTPSVSERRRQRSARVRHTVVAGKPRTVTTSPATRARLTRKPTRADADQLSGTMTSIGSRCGPSNPCSQAAVLPANTLPGGRRWSAASSRSSTPQKVPCQRVAQQPTLLSRFGSKTATQRLLMRRFGSKTAMTEPFVELHCHSNYSFLDGASHPEELVEQAAALGMPALALTDHAGVYGTVKFLNHARRVGIRPVLGTELEVDGRHLVLLARNMRGWSNLTRLLSLAHKDQPKGEARTTLEKLAEHREGLFVLTGCKPIGERRLRQLQDPLGKDGVFVELQNHLKPEDGWLAAGQAELAARCKARTVATNNVHYHLPARRPLHDVMTAIKNRMTLEEARSLLKPNSEWFLKDRREMQAVLGAYPEALATGWELAQACAVDLDFSQ